MKLSKKKILLPIISVLSVGSIAVTALTVSIFSAAAGGGNAITYNHYTTQVPTGTEETDFGVREYWVSCDDPTHKICLYKNELPSDATIKESGVASRSELIEQGGGIRTSDIRYIAPFDTIPEDLTFNQYVSTYVPPSENDPEQLVDTFVDVNTKKEFANQMHYTTYGYNPNLEHSHEFLDSSYVISDTPGEGKYITTDSGIHCLDLGDVNTSTVTLNEYISCSATETVPLYIGLSSNLSYIDDPTRTIMLSDVFEFDVNQHTIATNPTGLEINDVPLVPSGDVFTNYKIFKNNIALVAKSGPKSNYIKIRRKQNPNLKGNVRMGWFTSSAWPTYDAGDASTNRTVAQINNIQNGVFVGKDGTNLDIDNSGKSMFTNGYLSVPLDKDHVKLTKGTSSGIAFATSGGVTNINKINDAVNFNVEVSNILNGDRNAMAFIEVEMTMGSSQGGAPDLKNHSFLDYDYYNTSTKKATTHDGAFAFSNTPEDSSLNVKVPQGDLASGTSYFYLPGSGIISKPNAKNYSTVTSFCIPLCRDRNTIKIKLTNHDDESASWNSDYYWIKKIKIYSSNATLNIGEKPS